MSAVMPDALSTLADVAPDMTFELGAGVIVVAGVIALGFLIRWARRRGKDKQP